jgi:hypothetical protein
VYEVQVAAFVRDKAHERYGDERSPAGAPSESDFVGGPLAAALLEFRYFDELPEAAGPSVRSLIITDPFFGALVFFGVRAERTTVKIADFEDDPDYWSMIDPLA